MPNFDGGHYFLTVLAPIETQRLVEHDGLRSSAVHMVQSALATLPTARQTEATEWLHLGSPFARSTRTHFARFAVLNDTIYNGRDPENALAIALLGPNPVLPLPFDRLTTPFLMLAIDFDAASGDPAEVKAYLAELWHLMEAELTAVFRYCVGFGQVRDGASFADYIVGCQVETTMPFNDYWTEAPPLTSILNTLIGMAVFVVVLGVIAGWAMIGAGVPWGCAVVTALIGTIIVALVAAYVMIMQKGQMPFPAAPHSDLLSVLKSLYLQQRFTRFAIETQGLDDAALHERFGKFLADHKPDDPTGPTQPPGVVRTPEVIPS